MDTDKVIQDLNRRFAAPLPEFYQRRIIFWYDEDKEFEDKLDEVVLENAKVVALTGNNAFSVKKLLSVDDLTTNYLVYSPLAYNRPDDNWLLDIELYSEEFRADLISIWMDEMGLASNPAMRKQVKNYRAYFNAKDRRLKISTQNKVPATPAQLHMAVMAAICGLKDAQPNQILRRVFHAGLDLNNNAVYQDFVKYHADGGFWAMVRQGCGFSEEEPDLGRLAIHLLLTAATRTMRQEYLAGLDGFISMPRQAYCYDFISEWLHSNDIGQLYDVARYVEDEARLHQRFEKLTVDDLVGTECFPCINEVILTKLMTEISDHIIDVDTITGAVEKRRTCAWYEPFENFYDGILQVANMQSFFKEHSAGFHTAEAKGIWKEYTESYYQMDTYYRLFHLSFQKSLETSNILLDDLFKHVVDKVEGLYTHWFLGELGNNWSDVCADELATYGKVLEVPQQEEFYCSRIKTSDTKVFVIISDAMRYEVAATMADQLRRETQSKVSLGSMQSIFIRIKMNGGGMNFVHGGISLQEMVVPVIEYHYLRNDSMEYKRNKQKYDTKPVMVNLLSANRKISNMIFSLNFYQKDAVGANREAATYQVYFTDENGRQISDVQKIIADKTSDNGAERTFRCQFNLKSLKYSNTAAYYLVIADEQGLQMPQREPFQIDIAFAVDEFDFFS